MRFDFKRSGLNVKKAGAKRIALRPRFRIGPQTSATRPVLLICDIDSQLFACQYLAEELLANGCEVHIGIDYMAKVPPAVMSRHLEKYPKTYLIDIDRVATYPQVRSADAVGVFLAGSRLDKVCKDIRSVFNVRPRPLLFCGFNGLVFEKFEEAVAWRLGYDVICLNGPRDLRLFEAVIPSAFRTSLVALTGLNRGGRSAVINAAADRPKRVVFAEQVIVPKALLDRRYLVAQLARLAEASPDWEVVIKPRIRPGERTFHKGEEHIEITMQTVNALATNLRVSYEPLDILLPTARICLTVSSTAFFEAHSFGALPVIISDFGLRNIDGTHVFLGCGTMVPLHEVTSFDDFPDVAVSAQWLYDLGYSQEFGGKSLVKALALARGRLRVADAPTSSDLRLLPLPAKLRSAWLTAWSATRAVAVPVIKAGPKTSPVMSAGKTSAGKRAAASALFSRARAAYASEDITEARTLLERVCNELPNDAKPRRLLAECYIKHKSWPEARKTLIAARKLLPTNKNLQHRLRAVSGSPWKRRLKMLFSKPFSL